MSSTSILDWSGFISKRQDGTTVFNGVLFEELVREILKRHFDGIWSATPRTWDGGKDFVDRSISGQARWAECKMYRDALSLKAISNTLVMALSEQSVRQLLIFSYSPLNRQTRNHLASYSDATKIQVQSFDGVILENLVLNTPTALKRFFKVKSALKRKAQIDLDEVEITSFFSGNPQIDEQQLGYSESLKHSYKIDLRSPCVYQLIAKSNATHDNRLVAFDLSAVLTPGASIRLLNWQKLSLIQDKLSVSLQPGQISGVKLYLSFDQSGELVIPSIPITVGDKPGLELLPKTKVEVRFFTRPALIGGHVIAACRLIQRHVSANHTNLIVSVTGISGVGKSRFLDEVQNRLLEENFEVRGLDGAASGCRSIQQFSKLVLARLWRLPDPLAASDRFSEQTLATQAGDSVYDQVCAMIYGELLSDPLSDKTFDLLVSLICQGLSSCRTALLVDNVQALDSMSVKLLKQVSDKIQARVGNVCLVFAFNEQELTYSEEAFSFRQLLKEQHVRLPELVHYVELKEFTPDQVKLFLNQSIRLKTGEGDVLFADKYPLLTSLISEHVLPRPLDLFQFLKAAEDENFVEVHHDSFLIRDLNSFHGLVRSLQKTTASILERRWQHLQSNSAAVQALLLISLTGDASDLLLDKAGICPSVRQFLIQAGLIKIRQSGDYHYYHQSIERHFSFKLLLQPDDSVPLAAANLIQHLVTPTQSHVSALETLQLRHLLKNVNRSHILDAIEQLRELKEAQVSTRLEISAKILERYFDARFSFVSVTDYLPVLFTLCRLMSGRHQKELAEALIKYSQLLLKFVPDNDEALTQQFWIIRQAGSYARSSGATTNGLTLLKQGLAHLRLLPKSLTTSARARVTADLYDRVCLHHKSLGQKKDAVRSGKKAVRICQAFTILDVQCLSLIDLGYIHYGTYEDNPQLLFYWKQAVELFEKHYTAVTSHNSGMIYACSLIQATVISLEGDNNKALNLLDEMIQRAHRNGVPYYETQGLLVKAVVLLRHTYLMSKGCIDTVTASRVYRLVATAEDISLTYGMDKFIPDCHFLFAVCEASQNHIDEAAKHFKNMLNLMFKPDNQRTKALNIVGLALTSKAMSFLTSETGKVFSLPFDLKASVEDFEIKQMHSEAPATTLGIKGLELPCP